MRNHKRKACLLVLSILVITISHSQDLRAFNQHASRSNHTHTTKGFVFRITETSEKTTADSIAAKAVFMPGLSAHYYTGNWGVGAEFGTFNSSPHFNIAAYTSRISGFTSNDITSTEWKNWFLLAGPSFQKGFAGNSFLISADLLGGIMKMKPASFSVKDAASGEAIADYYQTTKQSTAGENPLFAIKPTLRFEWFPKGGAVGLNVHANYLQVLGAKEIIIYNRDLTQVKFDGLSQQEIRAQVLKAPVAQTSTKGPVSNYGFGAGISIRIASSRDAQSGHATGRKHIGNVKYEEVTITTREAGSGMATGRIISNDDNNGVVSLRDMQSGLPTGRRAYQPGQPVYGNRQTNESCGPVTLTTTNPDGTTEQRTFACPADAAQYAERISMNVTTPKQTQGATFGEKVNQGLHAAGGALSQGASRGVISGTINWGNGNAYGITTNEMAAVSSVGSLAGSGSGAAAASYAATGRMMNNNTNNNNSQGVVTTIYAREAGSGMATGRRSRDAGSGMATGRRQYEPVFNEGGNNSCTDCAVSAKLLAHELTHVVQQSNGAVKENPLYSGNGSQGTNPIHERSSSSGNGGSVCGTTSHFFVILTNADNGQQVAQTKPDSCGTFWFANVPVGNYAVRIKGEALVQKSYEVTINKDGKYDVAGEMIADNNQLVVQLTSSVTDSGDQKSKVTVRGWDPEKKESVSASDNKTATLLGGALPGGSVISSAFVAGGPIGGIIVKGGKNPGGSLRTTQTNEDGEFEFTDLEKGSYIISADLKYYVNDEIAVTVDGEQSERKGWDGTVKGGGKKGIQENGLTDNAENRKGWDGTVKGGSKTDDQQQRKLKGKIIKSGDTGMSSRIAPEEPVTFSWKSQASKTKETVTYRLKVWQLMQGQNGTQAMRSNQPIVTKDVDNITEATVDNIYTGPCKPPYLCDFIWQVQPVTTTGKITGNNEGGSFSIINNEENYVNTTKSNTKDYITALDKLDGMLDADKTNAAEAISSTKEKSVLLRVSLNNLENKLMNIGLLSKTSAVSSDAGEEIGAVDTNFAILLGSVNRLGSGYSGISTMLKTKHDTVKNSIGNIR